MQNMKMQNMKIQNIKMQNMKMQKMKIQNMKMFFVVSRLGHRTISHRFNSFNATDTLQQKLWKLESGSKIEYTPPPAQIV